MEPMPEKVISDRRNEQGELEVLVKWKNLPEFENSWGLAEKMRTKFPAFILEVKDSYVFALYNKIPYEL